MKELSDRLELYVLTDRRIAGGRDEVTVAREAVRGGATAIQLRGKEMNAREMFGAGVSLRRLTLEMGALFVVNDRADIAAAVGADGIHVGQDDLPPAEARKLLGPRSVVGVSVATVEEARRAEEDGADYLGVGPVFATSSKLDAGEELGPDVVRRIVNAVSIPVVGIGGIEPGNALQVIDAGAVGVAVIAAVVGATDIAGAASALATVVRRAKQSGGMRR